MKRGPKPQATHLKLLRGNPGMALNRLNFNEPKPDALADVPGPPSFLVGPGAEEWRVVCEQLRRLGMLVKVDLPVLAAYCHAFQQWRAAVDILAKMAADDPVTRGLLIAGRQNPLIAVAHRASIDMVRFANEFGFTPVARVRIQAPADGGKPSKFGELLAD
jgi:P27 family predicted phage terminase small subunit